MQTSVPRGSRTRVAVLLAALFSSSAAAQLKLTNTTPYAAGNNPTAVAIGDFNEDGVPDVAIANVNAGTVTILFGMNPTTGTTLMPDTSGPFTAGAHPVSIAVGDFNGDHHLDLAVANQTSGTITILFGDGHGGFNQQPSIALGGSVGVGNSPSSVVAGYFNGSAKPICLAVTNAGDGTVSVLIGNGSGGFSKNSSGSVTVGANPVSIATADLNNDGNPDLVVANLTSGNVTVLLGNGQGGFTFPAGGGSFSPIPTAPVGTVVQPISVVIGDFNNDQVPDIAVANQAGNNVAVLLGKGDGTFKAAPNSPFNVGIQPYALAAADFNSDGNLDLAVANYQSNNVMLLLGVGDGHGTLMQSSGPTPAVPAPFALAVGDFNLDNKPDLIVALVANAGIELFLNTFPGPVTLSAASGSTAAAPGSIISIFGSSMASTATTASTTPLPVSLGGTSVIIRDNKGAQYALPLFFTGPTQINAMIPSMAAAGPALLTVYPMTGSPQTSQIMLTPIAPALFSANQNGMGVAAAQLVGLSLTNGIPTLTTTNVFQCTGSAGTCFAVPLSATGLTSAALVFYGTGIVAGTSPAIVTFQTAAGSIIATPMAVYNGASSNAGEDQVNVTLPTIPAHSGVVQVTVTVTYTNSGMTLSMTSNPVTLFFP